MTNNVKYPCSYWLFIYVNLWIAPNRIYLLLKFRNFSYILDLSLGYTYMYIYTHTHIYVYINIYLPFVKFCKYFLLVCDLPVYIYIFFIYWSIADLQCCANFRCIAKRISYTYTYIHSLWNSFPSKPLQRIE